MQLCFPGIFFSQDLVFPRHHLTFGKKQDYHWVASDSWHNLYYWVINRTAFERLMESLSLQQAELQMGRESTIRRV